MNTIGIDIGGTKIRGIVVDEQGKLLSETIRRTEAGAGRDALVNKVQDIIADMLVTSPDIVGIGVGTAGRVNFESGEVVYATDNLPGWQGTNLKMILEDRYSLPTLIDNDGNTALIGEAWLGAGRGMKDLVMLTLGTGVGGANMIQDQLVRGRSWYGGEWGHVVLVPGGLPCNCGRLGCIEQYLSGTAFVNEAGKAAGIAYRTGQEALQDYASGNQAVAEALDQYLEFLSIALINIHLGINPQAIVIGGGLVDSYYLWGARLTEKLEKLEVGIVVKAAQLGNGAGAYGAARMVLQSLVGSNGKD